jgi:hypothetical protein
MATPKPTKPSSRKAAGVAKRKTALQLHVEGYTFEVIGQRLGISRQRAHKLVQEQIAEAAAERAQLATRALDTDLERVDFVLRSLAPKVEAGDDKAAQAYLRAMERRSKLLGLDAPVRTDGTTTLTGPDGGAVAIEIAQAEPSALHARLAAAAARAARGADPGGAPPADPAGAAGD